MFFKCFLPTICAFMPSLVFVVIPHSSHCKLVNLLVEVGEDGGDLVLVFFLPCCAKRDGEDINGVVAALSASRVSEPAVPNPP